MIRFVPPKDSFSGRWLARMGKVLGLRSETVYSRAILLTALVFIVLGGAVVAIVWYFMFRQFELADAQEARASAAAVSRFLAADGAGDAASPPPDKLREASVILAREVTFRQSSTPSGEGQSDGIAVREIPGGLVESSFRFGAGEVVISGSRPFHEAGKDVARLILVGLTLAGGITLLLILFIVDRTILSRIQLLMGKVEYEKDSERLPVKLDVPGDDEIAQLAGSIEELARLVQAAEREYRNVVEDQTESICRFDAEEKITFSNRAFVTVCEHAPAGRRPEMGACVDGGMLALLRDTIKGLKPDAAVTSFTHMVRKNGSMPVWYRSTLRANFGADGRLQGAQWIAADVTSEVDATRRLQESQQQLQVLSGRLMNLQDAERRRIARDLHDSTAQALSALEMNTSLLESMATDEKTRKLAADTAAISRQVCQELRNISYLLHPPLLEEEGLVFAIRWFVDGFTKRNSIPVFLDLPEDFPRLKEDRETALFRIVQEALSNIYRHAGATKAWITLRREEDGSVLLEIRDNGEGLPEDFSFTKSVGVGLAGMRERMKQLGGTLEVASSPYGVSVKCRLATMTSGV